MNPEPQQAKGDRPTVAIIIVNWNAGDQLRECLESIATTCRNVPFALERVVVVDNASSDGSADNLDSVDAPVTLIRNPDNRGFAAGCNQAASQCHADFLLLLNPDTQLLSDSISRPLQVFQDAASVTVGVIGVQLLDREGKVTPTCARFLTPAMVARKIFGLERVLPNWGLRHFMTDWDHATTRRVDHVMGAFYFVRHTLFRQLGGLDERFFVYLEDLDFSLRMRDAGFDTLYYAEARVIHRGGGSSEHAPASGLYYALSSRVLYGFKHFEPWTAWLLLVATLLVEPVTRVVEAAVARSPRRLRNTLTAYRHLWRSLPTLARLGRTSRTS